MLELAAKRGISCIDQLNLASIDAFEIERTTHRFKPKKKEDKGKGQSQDSEEWRRRDQAVRELRRQSEDDPRKHAGGAKAGEAEECVAVVLVAR
jgi:hypothetical protein